METRAWPCGTNVLLHYPPRRKNIECDTRSILKKAIQDSQNAGFQFFFGAEQEFYLFTLDDNGNPTKEPYDNAGYMDIAPEDRGENIRREVCLTLEQMGIQPESSHHEEGPGQNEIDFRYSDPLTAADNAMTFQTVVKTTPDVMGFLLISARSHWKINRETDSISIYL